MYWYYELCTIRRHSKRVSEDYQVLNNPDIWEAGLKIRDFKGWKFWRGNRRRNFEPPENRVRESWGLPSWLFNTHPFTLFIVKYSVIKSVCYILLEHLLSSMKSVYIYTNNLEYRIYFHHLIEIHSEEKAFITTYYIIYNYLIGLLIIYTIIYDK